MALLRAARTASDKCWLVTSMTGASVGYARGSVASSEIPSGISTLKSGSVGCIVKETVRLPEEDASETTRDEAYRLRWEHGRTLAFIIKLIGLASSSQVVQTRESWPRQGKGGGAQPRERNRLPAWKGSVSHFRSNSISRSTGSEGNADIPKLL
jgi:hypothetical protein